MSLEAVTLKIMENLISEPPKMTASQHGCEHKVNLCRNYILTCENCGYQRMMPMNLYANRQQMRKAKFMNPDFDDYQLQI